MINTIFIQVAKEESSTNFKIQQLLLRLKRLDMILYSKIFLYLRILIIKIQYDQEHAYKF